MQPSFSDEALDRIEEICTRFEQIWQHGSVPLIEEHLSEVEESHRGELLRQLIGIDLHYREQKGEPFSEEDYVARFPVCHDSIRNVFQQYGPPKTDAQSTLGYHDSERTETITLETVSVPGFDILEEIARGGMGVVYKARHRQLDCLVALKVVLAGQHASTEERERMLREAKAIATLQHPNIIHVFEVGEDHDQPYLALELCTTRTLADRIRENPLPPKEAAQIVETLARAMQVAHDAHIIHRDLKPGNVLLTEDGTLKITDFGLAKKLDEADGLTQTNVVMGTPSYAPPEQVQGKNKELDARVDVYALGAILYELVTGRPPFKAATTLDTILQVIRDEPVAPRQLNSRVPADLETICQRSLEKDPDHRYQTATELAAELRRFQNDEPIQARPISRVARAWRWCRRYPTVAGLVAAVFLVMVLGTAISSFFAIKATRNEAEALKLAGEKDNLATTALKLAGEKDKLAKDEMVARTAAETQKNATAWHLYVARLYPMVDAWKKRELGRLEHLLGESVPKEGEPDFRGWEWYYFLNQVKQASVKLTTTRAEPFPDWCQQTGKIAVLRDHRIEIWDEQGRKLEKSFNVGNALRLKWDPQGNRIAYTNANRVYVLTVANGNVSSPLEGHEAEIVCLTWSPDGKLLATGAYYTGLVNVWDAKSFRLLRSLPPKTGGRKNLLDLDWHPDGIHLAMAYRTGAGVWNTTNGDRAFQIKSAQAGAVAWSPDGKKLAAGFVRRTIIVDQNGRELHSLPALKNKSLQWSPDGKILAMAGEGQAIQLLDLAKGTLKTIRIHTSVVLTVRWSPDGKRLLSGSSWGDVRICPSTESDAAIKVPLASSAHEIAWRPGSQQLACAPEGIILEAGTGQIIQRLQGFRDQCLSWSPDGNKLISAGTDDFAVWNAQTGDRVRQLGSPNSRTVVGRASWSPSGELVVTDKSAGPPASLWDAVSWQNVGNLDVRVHEVLAWSFDGRFIAGWSNGSSQNGAAGKICVVDVAKRKQIFTTKCEATIRSAGFTPDGRFIAVGDENGLLHVCRCPDGNIVRTIQAHKGRVQALQFSANGTRFATGSNSGIVKIWDVATGLNLLTIDCGQPVHSVAWSSNNRSLAVACEDGIQIYHADAAMPDSGYGENVLLAQRATELTIRGPRDVLDEVKGRRDEGDLLIARFLVRLGQAVRIENEWISNEQDLDGAKGSITGARLTATENLTPLVIEQLVNLVHLQTLELDAEALDLARLVPLEKLQSVNELTLSHALISAKVVERLRAMPRLEKLILREPTLTPDGLAATSKLETLYQVSFSGLDVADSVVRKLADLRHVKRVELIGTRVTAATAEWLQSQLPDAQVVRDTCAQDRLAAEWVLKVGGLVTILDADSRKPVTGNEGLPKYPFRVVEINLFDHDETTDDDLARFKDLLALENLRLKGTGITDAGLKHLAGLMKLKNLRLYHTSVTGTGFQHLTKLKQLGRVAIPGVPITEEGLAQLAQFNSLVEIGFDARGITDESLRHLANLKDLVKLWLNNGTLTGQGLRHLTDLPNLRFVQLTNHRLTDDSLIHFGKIATLEILDIRTNTRIGDAGLKYLHSLKNLKHLDVRKTCVTKVGAELLRARLPGCEVDLEPIPRPEEVLAKLIKAIEADPKNVSLWFKRAEFHVQHRQWKEAVAASEQLLKLMPNHPLLPSLAAMSHLMAGNEKGYRDYCRTNLERLKKSGLGNSVSLFARVCSFLPNETADYEALLKAVQDRVKADPKTWRVAHAQIPVLYRLERYQQALEVIETRKESSSDLYRSACHLLWSAMCRHHLGERDLAKRLLANAVGLMEQEFPRPGETMPSGARFLFVECQIIRREAEALILGKKTNNPSGITGKE